MAKEEGAETKNLSRGVQKKAYLESRNKWLLSGWVLALISATGYLLAFLYEQAWFDVFGLPKEFMVIDWITITVAIGAFIGVALFIFYIFFGGVYLIERSHAIRNAGPIAERIVRNLIILLIDMVIVIRYYEVNPYLVVIFILPFYFIMIDFVSPIFTQKKVHGYKNKFKAHIEQAYAIPKIAPQFVKTHWNSILAVVFVILILALVAMSEGEKNAKTQEIFFTPSTYPQSVVLKIYEDILICAPYDQETRHITNSFFFLKLGDDPSLKLVPQRVGPLRRD